jgi:hypothetical protein
MVSASFAAPTITVEDVTIGNDLFVIATLANPAGGEKYSELYVGIQGMGTTDTVDTVKVEENTSKEVSFNLQDVLSSFSSLKKGEVYTLVVSTESGSQATTTFKFGTERDTTGLDVLIEEVEVNGEELSDYDSLTVLNGETINVKIRYYAYENINDAKFRVFVEGYEHGTLMDESSDVMNLVAGKTYTERLSITLPDDMDSQKDYRLKIEGVSFSEDVEKEYTLYIDTQRDRVDVVDLVMTPSSGIEPGQNLIANVRMKNRGQNLQDTVKVTVAIPELNIAESSFVSNLGSGEVITSDDMLLFIPETATAGDYTVEVSLSYDDGYDVSKETYQLTVLAPQTVQEKNLLVSYTNNVDLTAGESSTFSIVVANPNEQSKPISIAALDVAWADVEVSPSLAMVQGGSDATFTVTVTPKSAVAGEKELSLAIKEGTQSVSDIKVQTYVEPTEELNMTNIVLAVLLVIAIIVLIALVVTIARKKSDSDSDEDTEEYY